MTTVPLSAPTPAAPVHRATHTPQQQQQQQSQGHGAGSGHDAEGKTVGGSVGGFGRRFGGLFHSTSYAGGGAVRTKKAAAEAVETDENESPVATNVMPHRVALFAKSLREIEALRVEHNHMVGPWAVGGPCSISSSFSFPSSFPPPPQTTTIQLKQEFKVDALPIGAATDPNLFPVLNSKVQNLCLRFPLQAEEIAQRNGFEAEEFNSLLAKAKKNPFFRWRVSRLMEQQ